MDLVRVPQSASQLIKITFAQGGVPLDPDGNAATVGIIRDDGTQLVPPGTSAPRVEAGVYSFQLTPIHTEPLDDLAVTWAATFSGVSTTVRTRCEIVGGYLFTLAEARGAGLEESAFSDEEIAELRILVEDELERACSVAFVPRYAREQLDGEHHRLLLATWARIRGLRAITVGGEAMTSEDLALVQFNGRLIRRRQTWPDGLGNVEVVYEHGYDAPPAEIRRAALTLAKSSPTTGDGRTLKSFTTDDGSATFLQPGQDGAFGIAEVDRAVCAYDHRPRMR